MIIDLQRRIAEIGRIRIGQQVPAGKGTRPAKLDHFRLTSADSARIFIAAELYGGTPQQWQAPAGQQWEVVTETDTLPVIVPPGDLAFSQHYELWSAGGCKRRCDGHNEILSQGPCMCDPAARECDIHTRLSVMLRDLPGLGVWRLDTQGYYAATELYGAVEVIKLAAGQGRMLPAALRLEQRMVKRDGKTLRFPVPVLDIAVTPAQLLSGAAGMTEIEEVPHYTSDRAEDYEIHEGIKNGTLIAPGSLTPVPDTVPEWPTASVAEQVAAVKTKPRRKGAQTPIPATGIKPRTAAQAAAAVTEPPPDDLYESGPQPVAELPLDEVQPVSPKKMALLQIRFKERGFTDRGERLEYASGVVGRPLSSANDCSDTEIDLLLETLES